MIIDEDRIDYLKAHFSAAHRALQDGVRLAGYYVWTLMDNFEWALGYTKRFGLFGVDNDTQERIWKKSAQWYRQVIKDHGVQGSEEVFQRMIGTTGDSDHGTSASNWRMIRDECRF